MNIVRISIIPERNGPDLLILHFDGPSGCWPYTDPATAQMSVVVGSGEKYARENFSNIPLEVIKI